jgi:hypothetical protein
MRVIVAGSRNIKSYGNVLSAIAQSEFKITEVVSGTAPGVDTLGEHWAEYCNVPIRRFPADWNQHGKRAGVLRNQEMADYADALIAVWDGESPGTKNMINEANKRGLKVYIHYVE